MNISAQIIVNERLIPFHNNQGKWGYMDADSDKIVISAKYDFVNLFENRLALVGNSNPNATTLDNKYLSGYIRENGEEILPINFTGIYEVKNQKDTIFQELKNITFENGSNGILKLPDGKWLVEPGKYNSFKFYKPNEYLADFTDFYDGNKKHAAPKDCEIQRIDFENQFFYIMKGEKEPNKGICTWEGEIIIEPKYIDIQYIEKIRTFLASTIFGKLTLKNIKSKSIDNFLFDENGKQVGTFKSEKIPFVRENEVFGSFEFEDKDLYIDLKTGQLISEPKSSLESKEIIFQDLKTGLYGLKDLAGNTLIKTMYGSLKFIGDKNYLLATKEQNYKNLEGLIDAQGNILVPLEYEDITYRNSNLIIAKKNDKYGAIDNKNNIKIDFKYKYDFYFNNGFANVHTNEGEGVIDSLGKIIVPTKFISVFRQEIEDKILINEANYNYEKTTFFSVKKDEKWGLIDIKGKWIIPLEYGYISKDNYDKNFLKGWINTQDLQRDKSGLVNIITNTTIPPIYDSIEIFDNFLIANKRVGSNYTYQLLHLDGKPISEIVYNKMDFTNGYFIVEKNNLEGIMNIEGQILVPLKFKYIWAETSNLIRIWDNERYYFINVKSGKEFRIKD